MSEYVQKGMGQKTSDFLVIPLDWELHVGSLGIDSGQPWLTATDWEARFGTQVELLDEVYRRLGENIWRLAGIDREVNGLGNGKDRKARLVRVHVDNI